MSKKMKKVNTKRNEFSIDNTDVKTLDPSEKILAVVVVMIKQEINSM